MSAYFVAMLHSEAGWIMPIKTQSPVKFLLVDDMEENLLILDAFLARPELELLHAHSGMDALALLEQHDIALALVDVHMPEMDGFRLAERMRQNERTMHVPIIFVTAGVQERGHIFEGYDAGAVDFLFKPIDSSILKHKTETFFQLYRQRQQLAEMLRTNEELMAVVGHDLRNPLGVILMTASLLAEDANDPEIRKAAQRLQNSGKRMQSIIEELFDLSRARLAGGIPVERRPLDLLATIKRVIAELETTYPHRRIELRQKGNLTGEFDAGRMEQVLSNLIGNALRHGSKSSPVTVTAMAENGSLTLTVHNEGFIPPDLLPRLFDPFQPGPEARTRTEGLGLGLYIVKQIVLAHGGWVDVRSTDREGTTFHVRLPRKA
jgi:signal transduction histidine kinase